MITIRTLTSRRRFLSRSVYGALGLTTGLGAITSLTAERTGGARRETWQIFSKALTLTLADLDVDEFLILERRGTHRYLQFRQDTWGLRAESVSNRYLSDAEHLSQGSRQALLAAGWKAPRCPRMSRNGTGGARRTTFWTYTIRSRSRPSPSWRFRRFARFTAWKSPQR
jgi:hypothetical protein